MNKTLAKSLKVLAMSTMLLIPCSTFMGCDDEIDESNRFTFKGELIATHLQNNPDKFSNFAEILRKARIGDKASGNMLRTLSTYGSYTCFAPTNEAVEKFLQDQYNRYLNGEDTGITGPTLEELSDSMATVIAKNHIIERGYRTIDIEGNGSFPRPTMNRRSTTISWPQDNDGQPYALINDHSRIITQDVQMENGFIQVISEVLNPSNKPVPELLIAHEGFKIFGEALFLTGYDEYLRLHVIDKEYDNTDFEPNSGIGKEGKAPYPDEKRQRFTLFVEPDDVLANPANNHLNIPITTIDALVKFAEEWYGTEARGEYENPNNALNKFVAYHILDRQLQYSTSSGPGGFIMENYTGNNGFNSEVNMPTYFDRYDYFETKLPYTMIKVTKPFTNPKLATELVINYAQEMGTVCKDPRMAKHINVVIERASDTQKRPGLEKFDQNSINGFIHAIDRILVYNEAEMAGNILNERMRWDVSSFFPELTNNGIRWASQDISKTTYIPDGYCERFKVLSNDTHVYYLHPHATSTGGYANYQGDELLVTGTYDFKYRIPHVPTGDYEIRFGFSQSDLRAVTQFYFDDKICGIPVDMKWTKNNTYVVMGWFKEIDEETGTALTEEEIIAKDKTMRNHGFMKGPASCHLEKGKSMRESELAIRKIIGTYRLNNGTEYWLRFKNVTENTDGKQQFNQDFLEIVPTTIISDPLKPEDIY